MATLKLISEKGPEKGADRVAEHYTQTMDDLIGMGSTVEKRSAKFSQHGSLRAWVLRNNADTSAAFVMATKVPAQLMVERAARRWWKL